MLKIRMNYEELIREVLKYYDLGFLKNKPKILKGGFVNLSLKFETNNGSFVLKKYSKEIVKDSSKINDMLKFLYEIKSSTNFPVAKPFKTNSNEFLCNLKDEFYSISEFVEGKNDDYHDLKLINAAQTLAKLHKETQKAVLDDKLVLTKVTFKDSILSLWDVSNVSWKNSSLKEKIESKATKSEIDFRILNEYIPFVQRQFEIYLMVEL